jgi:hypothetical protein
MTPENTKQVHDALVRLQGILESSEKERFSPTFHRQMVEAQGLIFALGLRIVHLNGGWDTITPLFQPQRSNDSGCNNSNNGGTDKF